MISTICSPRYPHASTAAPPQPTSSNNTTSATKKSILKKVEAVRPPRDPEAEFLLGPEDLVSPRISAELELVSPRTELLGVSPSGSSTHLVRTRSCSPAEECFKLSCSRGEQGARGAANVYRSLVSTPSMSKKLVKIVRTSSQGMISFIKIKK